MDTSMQGSKKTPKDFHNSIGVQGAILFEYKGKATSQQSKIYAFLKENPGKKFTPFEVWEKLFPDTHPAIINSVRRSLTNLQKSGWIKKSDEKVIERLGVENHKWYY